MALSTNISAHIATLRTIPACIPPRAIFPPPAEAKLIALPQPVVIKKAHSSKRTKRPLTNSASLANVYATSRLSYEAEQTKIRHQMALDLQTAKGLSWQLAYDQAWTAQNLGKVVSRTRSGRPLGDGTGTPKA